MGWDTFDRLCKTKGVTAYQVAKSTGVTTSTLSSWKKGRYAPKDEKLQKLADYFGVTVQYLRSGDDVERDERMEKIAKGIHEHLANREALGITNEEWDLLEAYRMLNDEGKKKSQDYVIDMTWNEKYKIEKNKDGYIRY